MHKRSSQSVLLRKVNHLASRLYSLTSLENLGEAFVEEIDGLIGCDTSMYCAGEVHSGTSVYYADTIGDILEECKPTLNTYLHQLPFISYYTRNSGGKPKRTSDLVSLAAWRRCELFNEAFQRMGIEEQLGVEVPGNPAYLRGILLNRGRRSFTHQDLQVLEMVKCHLASASAAADHWLRMESPSEALWQAEPCHGTVLLDAKGNPVLWSPCAQSLLAGYMDTGSAARRHLPSAVQQWVHAEVAMFYDANLWQNPRRIFRLKRTDSILTLRLSSSLEGEGHILLIEESRSKTHDAVALNRLTPREKEILQWLAQGKTNEQIAIILHLSVYTVKNHVKHILGALGVDNRTSAAGIWLNARSA